MIPELPSTCTDVERLVFYSDLLSNLEDQSTIHTSWHTHKKNPSVCWICDIPICARKITHIVETLINAKSPLDSEIELSSDDESDTESENEFFNKNDEPEPEYDTIDDSEEEEQV